MQVVYHARMAEEDGAFAFSDVVAAICDKMIRRHPHVFGDDEERAEVDLDGLWERLKAQEKTESQADGSAENLSERTLDGVPLALPALVRAVKLQHAAARVGFDWPTMKPVFEKAREEFSRTGGRAGQGRQRS